MMFVVENIDLRGDLKIVARQVDAHGKKIDFGLEDASGKAAKLEAWNQKRWQKELANNAGKAKPQGAFGHLVAQLKAAKGTGEPVYLAVFDGQA